MLNAAPLPTRLDMQRLLDTLSCLWDPLFQVEDMCCTMLHPNRHWMHVRALLLERAL